MKRLAILIVAPLLANCAAIPTAISAIGGLTQAVSVNQDKVLVPATQALIIAHNAYQSAAAAATAAITAGLVPKEKLPQIAALDNRAKALLDQADAGQNVAQNVAEVMNIISTMKSLAGR